ncbi:MAG: hypothetical protein HYX21_02235 [Candidatus Yanofskybacteria bacterium]|nr:hypothetical protein [Candidatus Yanofskybacteria bacterium]
MPTPAITKKLTQKGDFVIIPRKGYEEFLAWRGTNKRIETYTPTPAEKRAIAKAKRNFTKGNYVTWEELKHELASNR